MVVLVICTFMHTLCIFNAPFTHLSVTLVLNTVLSLIFGSVHRELQYVAFVAVAAFAHVLSTRAPFTHVH